MQLRHYPLGAAAAHITGYLSSPNEDQQAELQELGFPTDTKVGATGLESSYEETLRGKDGVAVEILDSDGNVKSTVYESDAVLGKDLVLSINSYTQELAYYSLASVSYTHLSFPEIPQEMD